MDEMARGEEFIRHYNELDHQLKKLSGDRSGAPFWKRARMAARRHPTIRRVLDDLLEYHELRNAIVHHRDYPKRLIASPAPAVVEALARIVAELSSPKLVMPTFASDVRCFAPGTLLVDVLRHIHERSYTQVVARVEGALALLTTADIAQWLAAQAGEHPVDLAGVTLANVLPFCRPSAMELIGRDGTVEEARQRFEQSLSEKRRLFAIIITEHGAPTEDPLGIITPADLLEGD